MLFSPLVRTSTVGTVPRVRGSANKMWSPVMKKRTDAQRSAFIPGDVYGQLLPGFTVNLLVRDIDVAVPFYRDVLSATVHYADPDFAAVRVANLELMLHADHTYEGHPWYGPLQKGDPRGLGPSYGCSASILMLSKSAQGPWARQYFDRPPPRRTVGGK